MRRTLALISLLFALPVPLAAQERDDPDKAVANVLAVQNALYQGRQHLLKGESKQAVELLESKLPYINGNRDYLGVLRDAYWAYIKELHRAGQNDKAGSVLARLKLLDPTAKLDGVPELKVPTAASLAIIEAPKPETKARGKADDADPFQQTPILAAAAPGMPILKQAATAFSRSEFAAAEVSYDKAHTADPLSLNAEDRGRWAYCILHRCRESLARGEAGPAVERDINQALLLSADNLQLKKVGENLLADARVAKPAAGPASIRHLPPESGWSIAESANYRLVYRQTPEKGEQILSAAEQARRESFAKWFGSAPVEWTPKCEIIVFLNSDDYSKVTKSLSNSHGHTTLEVKNGKIASRRIDLTGDAAGLLTAAIPREVTHVVLADLFSEPLLPRWADEAMSILAEPRGNVERYLKTLPRCRAENTLMPVGQLLTMVNFPDAKSITPFYVESVSLVDMLVAEKGPKSFAIFLQDARRYGYEKALERNYGFKNYNELQNRWLTWAERQ